MEKNEVLHLLDSTLKKYDALPEKNRLCGFKNSPEENVTYNYETYPGIYSEFNIILNNLSNSPLLNDLDIAMKIVQKAPYNFGYLGKQARENIDIFLEACKSGENKDGSIGWKFNLAGDNLLKSEKCMIMVLQIDPTLFKFMLPEMRNNPKVATQFVKAVGYIPDALEEDTVEYLKQANKEDINYKVVGMRTEKYIGPTCSVEDDHIKYYDGELEKDILCCTKGDKKYEISLETTYDEDYNSPYTKLISFGHMNINSVEEFGEIEHVPNQQSSFELILKPDGFECNAFSFSHDGGFKDNPIGQAFVNMKLFTSPELSMEQASDNSLLTDDITIDSDTTHGQNDTSIESMSNDIKECTGYSFEEFIAETKDLLVRPMIIMGDGVKLNVQASVLHYCEPEKTGLSSYNSYEVKSPSVIIKQLIDYVEYPVENEEELLHSLYPFVPAKVLSEIIFEHGGIDKEATLNPNKKLDVFKQEKEKGEKAIKLAKELLAQLEASIYPDNTNRDD